MRTATGPTGLLLALASAAAFGTSGVLASSLIGAGWSAGAAVTLRIAFAALALTVPAVLALRALPAGGAVLRRRAGAVAAYGLVAVAGCQLCYFEAVPRLGVGVALLLEYLGSVLVVLWMWLRHGHRPRRLTAAGAALAVLGLVLVLDVLGDARFDVVGVVWGLGAGVGLATYFVLSAGTVGAGSTGAGTDDAAGIEHAGEPQLPPVVMAWGGMALGALALGTAAAVGVLPFRTSGDPVRLLDRAVDPAVSIALLALVAGAFAYVAGIGAARLLGAKVATFVGLTEVLFAVLFAWLALDEVLAAVQVAGGLVVLAGVTLVKVDESRGPVVG